MTSTEHLGQQGYNWRETDKLSNNLQQYGWVLTYYKEEIFNRFRLFFGLFLMFVCHCLKLSLMSSVSFLSANLCGTADNDESSAARALYEQTRMTCFRLLSTEIFRLNCGWYNSGYQPARSYQDSWPADWLINEYACT